MERSEFVAHRMEAIVFDVIGTLVDEDSLWKFASNKLAVEAGIDAPEDLNRLWASLLNDRMNAVISGSARWRSHRQLVSESADEAVAQLGGCLSTATSTLVSTIDRDYRAWPDVADATATLRRNRLVAGVSNGDLDSLARLANSNAISWDVCLSTGAVRTFKPAPAAYQYAVDTLDLNPVRTLFVASHPWDLRAAAEHGFRTAYVARTGAELPAEDDHFDLEVDDLEILARALN